MTTAVSPYGPVAADIPRVGQRLRGLVNGHHPLLSSTLAYVFETQGKQLRPALVMLSGKLGEYDIDRLVTLAASLEVVHTATLVHDDTIDQALTRRGLKTVSAMWNSKIAILLGDFLFAQSAHLAAQLNSVRIMGLLSETVMAMSTGELRQYASSQAREIDESDYFQRVAGKTASLFAMCCEGAAIVSNQSEEHVQALRAFGTNLGIAFQIVDDVLDFLGDEQSLGKPAGNDLREGTITLPLILLTRQLSRDDPLRRDLSEGKNIEQTITRVRHSGALDDAMLRAGEYMDAARSALSAFPDSEAREALCQVGDRVLSRQR
jgi:geranylgeranyl pyrophosphate synthase